MIKSNIDWIGNIPVDWHLLTIGSIFKLRNEKVNDTDYPPLSVSRGGIVPQMDNVAKSDANDNRKLVLKNDFVINSRSDRKQSCGVSALDGSVSLINLVLYSSDNNQITNEYPNYMLKNYGFAEEFYRWGHGIVADLWTTRWQEMKNIVIPVPPINVQNRIISVMKNKEEQIKLLISNTEKQIVKLKEYKQCLITNVVTKGLDPNCKMKDSGFDWMGNIPENWCVKRLKFIPDYTQENAFIDGDWIESPDITNEGIRYFTTGNVGDGIFKNTGEGYISAETFERLNCKYAYNGDWVISRLNAPYGRSCILSCDEGKAILAVDLVICRTNENKKYLCYVTQCPGYQRTVEDSSRGTAMKRISRTNLGNISFPIPPIDEQNAIVNFLDEKCTKIDKLIELKNMKLEKLQSYKKSLIYEYVTGKREVRED